LRGVGGVFSIRRRTASSLSSSVLAMIRKAPYQASDEQLEAGRLRAYQRPEGDMFADVGFFMCWFATAEYVLTSLLAFSTASRDFEAFDILCRGMDARVKIERLRKSAARHGGIGPNLTKRLDVFEKGAIHLRNKIVHNAITHNEDDGDRRYFLSGPANAPWAELGMVAPKTSQRPIVVRSVDLYAWGTWLSFFTEDLNTVSRKAMKRLALEIDEPKSRLPPEDQPASRRKADRAMPDRPAEK
jgi:hypothetical protein